jgi:hypothetical protein
MVEPFPITSRYHGLAIRTWTTPAGKGIPYLSRRFLPAPDQFELLSEHAVGEGDRLDLIAARYLDDPEQFWRLCDANNAMRPERLVAEVGRRLRITLPEGVRGVVP